MRFRMLWCLLAAVAAAPAVFAAQSSGSIVIIQPVKHDTSPVLSDLLPGPVSTGRHEIPLYKPGHGGGGGGGGGSFTDPLLQNTANGSALASFTDSFEGVGYGFPLQGGGIYTDPYIPPDTNGAAGKYQYVQWVNVDFAVFNTASAKGPVGQLVYGAAPGSTIWSGFGGSCETNNGGDPIVQYDKLNNVWLMMQIQYSGFGGGGGNYLCIAVSNGPDWTDPAFAWQRYAFKASTLTDYPKMAVWTDGYYVTYNAFKGFGTFAGPVVCAFNGSDMRAGVTSPRYQCKGLSTSYSSLLPADIDSVSQQPAPSEPEYLLSMGNNALLSWRYSIDWTAGTASLSSAQTVLTSASIAFQPACGGGTCIPQTQTTQQLDSLGDRLMYRVGYRNFGGYESLVVNQSVTASSTAATTGIRWYELRNTPGSTASPSIYQAGTYALSDGEYRWMGSAAMDAAGNIAVGYSISGSDMYPGIRVAARCSGDTLGKLGGEISMQEGNGSQTGYNRWGDYSSMNVDPNGSLWYTTEYLTETGSDWHTRIGHFTISGCQ